MFKELGVKFMEKVDRLNDWTQKWEKRAIVAGVAGALVGIPYALLLATEATKFFIGDVAFEYVGNKIVGRKKTSGKSGYSVSNTTTHYSETNVSNFAAFKANKELKAPSYNPNNVQVAA